MELLQQAATMKGAILDLSPCFTDLSNSLPVARHHSFVSHEFQQGDTLTEFINSFL